MRLAQYLETLPSSDRAEFATRCGTSVEYLRQIATGERNPKAQLAVTIARESRGLVDLEPLVPDLDWSYLRRILRPRARAT